MPDDRSSYILGPWPGSARTTRPTAPAATTPAAGAVHHVPEPTRWKEVPGGRVVLNPNECMICHRPPHPTTPHHPFIPSEAVEYVARRLGWPLPDNQEPLP